MWYRLVGVDLSLGNLTADVATSIRIFTGQLDVELTLGTLVQVVVPDTASVTSGAPRCRESAAHISHWQAEDDKRHALSEPLHPSAQVSAGRNLFSPRSRGWSARSSMSMTLTQRWT